MTAGTDCKTIDGMSVDRIEKLINSLKDHSYHPNPVRREYIEKQCGNGKKRPLGTSSFDDKLVQEVVRMILVSIYEPTFSNLSHGFRQGKSCHTALLQVQANFTGTKWFIEGNIKSFFDTIDHSTLVNILRRRIKDEYFIALIWKFLKAGYMESNVFYDTYSGTAQGSIISPVLSNIFLNEFDKFIEGYDFEAQDSGYSRLFYVRYAENWLCGVIGSKADAEQIKADIKAYLSDTLKLELSEEKTLITNAHDPARFLGYDVFVADNENIKADKNGHTRRTQNGKVKLYVPRDKWQGKLFEYKALEIKYLNGKETFNPIHRTYLVSNDDLEIINQYNAEIRGMYNYYRIADNVSVLGHFNYVMKFSMFKTFGAKYKLHISQVRKKYGYKKIGVKHQTQSGEETMYFYDGGFQKKNGIENAEVDIVPKIYRNNNPTSRTVRLKSRHCEWCGVVKAMGTANDNSKT